MHSDCYKCTHSETCKFKEKCLEFISKKSKLDEDLDFITVEYTCKYFKESIPTTKGFTTPDYWPNGTGYTTTWNRCMNCDWYQKYILGGEIYVGDSPCQWCNKYPYKITCDTTTSDTTTVKNNLK